jgi:protein ImuB
MIARIANVVGEGNVGAPLLVDTHRPGEFQIQRFPASLEVMETNRDGKDTVDRGQQRTISTVPTSFRTFRPAIPARLELRAGVPAGVFFQDKCGEVLAASGPWRTSGDWWQQDFWQQEEWDLEIRFPLVGRRDAASANPHPGDGIYLLYYDAVRRGWFVEGIYD